MIPHTKKSDSYEQFAEAQTDWDEQEHAARSPEDDDVARSTEDGDDANDKESRLPTITYKTLMGQLYGWMHQLPVIGLNSGKYDLNAIKQFLIPYFLSTPKTGTRRRR